MSWRSYNPNPKNNRVGDCTVRAISIALGQTWEDTYTQLCLEGLLMADIPSSDVVWGSYLKKNGFRRKILDCENGLCKTVKEFCEDHPKGLYLLCPKNHVLCVVDGDFYDTWDSGNEIVIYYWIKENES